MARRRSHPPAPKTPAASSAAITWRSSSSVSRGSCVTRCTAAPAASERSACAASGGTCGPPAPKRTTQPPDTLTIGLPPAAARAPPRAAAPLLLLLSAAARAGLRSPLSRKKQRATAMIAIKTGFMSDIWWLQIGGVAALVGERLLQLAHARLLQLRARHLEEPAVLGVDAAEHLAALGAVHRRLPRRLREERRDELEPLLEVESLFGAAVALARRRQVAVQLREECRGFGAVRRRGGGGREAARRRLELARVAQRGDLDGGAVAGGTAGCEDLAGARVDGVGGHDERISTNNFPRVTSPSSSLLLRTI